MQKTMLRNEPDPPDPYPSQNWCGKDRYIFPVRLELGAVVSLGV